jgi:hypothetical protein
MGPSTVAAIPVGCASLKTWFVYGTIDSFEEEPQSDDDKVSAERMVRTTGARGSWYSMTCLAI